MTWIARRWVMGKALGEGTTAQGYVLEAWDIVFGDTSLRASVLFFGSIVDDALCVVAIGHNFV